MRIPYRRRPSPVPNAANGRKEKSIACSECHNCQKRRDQCKKRSPGCRREQENHSQKVCNANQIFQLYQGIDISTKKRSTEMPLCLAFGTGEGLLWYVICVPCSKRLPGVRDASSEALGAQNRLLRYGRDIRCQKQASVVRDASSKARRTADSTDCGQPPAAAAAASEACRAKSSTCPPDAASVRERAPALFVRSGGPFPCPFDGTRYQKRPPLGGEQI